MKIAIDKTAVGIKITTSLDNDCVRSVIALRKDEAEIIANEILRKVKE